MLQLNCQYQLELSVEASNHNLQQAFDPDKRLLWIYYSQPGLYELTVRTHTVEFPEFSQEITFSLEVTDPPTTETDETGVAAAVATEESFAAGAIFEGSLPAQKCFTSQKLTLELPTITCL